PPMNIINPATESIISQVSEDSAATLQQKHELLRSGFKTWSKTATAERVAILRNFSSLLEQNIESLATILTSEVGKPLQQSRNEVNAPAPG
ncbi:MAG: aldehyde dehydrogenase family protein, partial [Bacteroidota bacterium]